jgi:hypothetical protein
MIERKDLLDLAFYEKLPFKGSDHNMRYKVGKIMVGEDEENQEKCLEVTTWPGPYSFEATDTALMEKHIEAFSEEGLEKIVAYLNSKYSDYNKEEDGTYD